MITIISGPINSGKTTLIEKHYHEHMAGSQIKAFSADGFISNKIMDGKDVVKFQLRQLSTGYEMDFIIPFNQVRAEGVARKVGTYALLEAPLKWANACLKDMIGYKTAPIYLDEIGQVELEGGGFDPIFRKLLNSKLELTITIRDSLVESVIKHYDIKDYKIIKAGERRV